MWGSFSPSAFQSRLWWYHQPEWVSLGCLASQLVGWLSNLVFGPLKKPGHCVAHLMGCKLGCVLLSSLWCCPLSQAAISATGWLHQLWEEGLGGFPAAGFPDLPARGSVMHCACQLPRRQLPWGYPGSQAAQLVVTQLVGLMPKLLVAKDVAEELEFK